MVDILIDQLTNDSLLRLWKTGALNLVHTADLDDSTEVEIMLMCVQLSMKLFMKVASCASGGKYGLSKDLDVVLWIAQRELQGKPKLKDTSDFVIIDSALHDEFDSFKACTIQPGSSFVPVNELLSLYCSKCPMTFPVLQKFGSYYTELTAAQIDLLVEWVLDMRSKYNQVGEMAISDGIDALLCSSPKGQ